MQIYADVTGRPFRLSGSDQTPRARLRDVRRRGRGSGRRRLRHDRGREPGDGAPQGPRLRARSRRDRRCTTSLYREYVRLHDYFGRGENDVMKTLRGLRATVEGRARLMLARADPPGAASDLHALLPKNELVVWTGGNVSARDPETGLVAIKPSRRLVRGPAPRRSMVVVDLDGNVVEGDVQAVLRHRQPPVHLPPPAGRQRRRPHPLALRDRLRRRRPPDPGLPHRPGRRVRRRDPVRRLRADRRRGDRPARGRGHRQLAGDPAQEPRRVHGRPIGDGAVKAAVMTEDVARDRVHGAPARARPTRSRPTPWRSSTTGT